MGGGRQESDQTEVTEQLKPEGAGRGVEQMLLAYIEPLLLVSYDEIWAHTLPKQCEKLTTGSMLAAKPER